MIVSTKVGLVPLYRHVPWVETITIRGVDLSSATVTMQFRETPEADGDALISLTETSSPAQGITVSVTTEGAISTTVIEMRIDEATIEAIDPPGTAGPRGADVPTYWDMIIDDPTLKKGRWFHGESPVKAGVTR